MTDTDWWPLKKGTSHVYVEYGYTHATLFAKDTQLQKGPPVTISMDLERSLRMRSKSRSKIYIDADSLAEGEIKTLKQLELRDEHIVKGVDHYLQYTDDPSPPWRLVINLRGQHEFTVEPEFNRPGCLILKVT